MFTDEETLQMRKLRIRELKRPCAQGHTVNRCGLQPRASGPQECVLSYTPVGDNEGVWGDAENTLPLWTKYCVYCTQHSLLVASLHVPHSPNFLFGAAVVQQVPSSVRNTKATLGLLCSQVEDISFSDFGKTCILNYYVLFATSYYVFYPMHRFFSGLLS